MLNYDKTDDRIIDALDVIAKYDPALYRRMMRDDWTVTFRMDGLDDDLRAFLSSPGSDTYGATMPQECTETDGDPNAGRTTLADAAINREAQKLGVPVPIFTAAVVVHEYRHIGQQCWQTPLQAEMPAFDASTEFAQKLPAPYGERMAQFSEESRTNNIISALLY
jgi:hypothetical protein